jgi:DNA-binding MarR family transcriptional regulator
MTPDKKAQKHSSPPDKTVVLSEIFDNLRRVFQVVHEHSRRVERDTGLTGPQVWAIRVIAENEPIKVSNIARRMYLHVATVVGIVDRLEARGLVHRTRDTKDRRVVHVALTAEGRALVASAPQVAQGKLLSGLEELPDRKLKTIHAGLELMVRLLNAQKLPPRLLLSQEVNVSKPEELHNR